MENSTLLLEQATAAAEEYEDLKSGPSLHRKWVEKVGFVLYQPPPPPFCESSVKEEWLERISFLQEDLQWLLKLPHSKFWSQVVFDEQLQKCLDSYLRRAPRHFDVWMQHLDTEVQEAQQTVHKLIFFIFLRLSTYKESKTACFTPSEFGEIIYQNFIFDIPKIMDLCALYSPGNEALLNKMITNIFTQQPAYNKDLARVIPTIIQVFECIQEKLGLLEKTKAEKLGKLTSMSPSKLSWADFSDVVFYIIDISTTLHALFDIYSDACHIFHQQCFHIRISGFFHTVFPVVKTELQNRAKNLEITLDVKLLQKKLSFASQALVKAFRQIIFSCCLQPALDKGTADHHEIGSYIDDFLQIMTVVQSDRNFICLYGIMFPFEEDVDMLSQFDFTIDSVRIQYILDGIEMAFESKGKKKKKIEERNPPADDCTCESGPATVATSIVNNAACEDEYEEEDVLEGACASARITGVELDSLITQVKDLLPELGDGFIEQCLEHYNYSVESTIHRLLENSLPSGLDKLDRTLPRQQKNKAKPNDQGLIPESSGSFPLHEETSILLSRKNIYDNDEFDVFRRDDIDLSRVILGKKKDSYKDMRSLLDDKKDLDEIRYLYSNYDEEPVHNSAEYEDEYDDTYDSHNIGAEDDDSADELITRRPLNAPLMLDEESEDEEEKDQPEKGLPNCNRDEFVANPEKLREQRKQHTFQREARDVHGKARGQGQDNEVLRNRAFKERHKNQRANHNRKNLADRKRAFH